MPQLKLSDAQRARMKDQCEHMTLTPEQWVEMALNAIPMARAHLAMQRVAVDTVGEFKRAMQRQAAGEPQIIGEITIEPPSIQPDMQNPIGSFVPEGTGM